ncbi:MAG: tetratricopeptide repeat protein [Chloroflexi bacterium]|nr:tetratricopeptide repeat protein [Chloroflexota bacterium]
MMKRFLRLVQISLLTVLLSSTLVYVGERNITFNRLANYFLAPTDARQDVTTEQVSFFASFLSSPDRQHFERYQDRLKTLLAQFDTPTFRQYRVSREALEKAKLAEAQSRFDEAVTHYQEAYEQGPKQVQLEALLGLARVWHALGNPAAVEQVLTQAAAFNPPDVTTRQELCPGWRLAGAYVDRQGIRFDAPVRVILVWEQRIEATAPQPDRGAVVEGEYTMWKNRAYQMVRLKNLVRDGGFNQVASQESRIPQGFKFLFRGQTRADTRFVTDPAFPERGVFLRLESQGEHAVGIGSESFPVQPTLNDRAYLVGVTYRSAADSLPRIGAYWMFPNAKTVEDNETDYAVAYPAIQWRRATYLAASPRGATQVAYWALEANPHAFLDIDDLFLLPLPLHCFDAVND